MPARVSSKDERNRNFGALDDSPLRFYLLVAEFCSEFTAVSSPRVGALLIHGLGGTEFDMGSLHKVLTRADIQTHTVALPGHASRPEDLLGVRAEDWLNEVTRRYRELQEQYDVLHVIGMCMGALLAVELCKREGHVNGALVALSAPVYLDGWSTPWYRGLRYLVYRLPCLPRRMKVAEEMPFGVKSELVRSFIRAGFARGDGFHYQWVPLACVRQVDRLRAWVKQGSAKVMCPTLIIHAEEDELTSPRSARWLHDNIADSTLIMLNDSYHMICVDNERTRVMQSVLSFFGKDPGIARTRGPRGRTRAVNAANPLSGDGPTPVQYDEAIGARVFLGGAAVAS